MSPSRPFILRPVATSLLMLAIVLAGLVGLRLLPLSALPQVDYPTIQVQTLYPGASPEVMSRTVTAPLERQFGQMAGLDRMSTVSSNGVSIVTLQFALDQTLDVAEQQVQAAINAGRSAGRSEPPAPPVYAKVNPADAPVLTLAISSDTVPLIEVQNLVNTRLAQKISQVSGVGLVTLAGGQRPAVRIQADTRALASYGLTLDNVRTTINAANANGAKGSIDGPTRAWSINSNDQLLTARDYSNLVVAFRNNAPVRLGQVAQVVESAENVKLGAWSALDGQLEPSIILNVQRQPGANVIATVDAIKQRLPELTAGLPASLHVEVLSDRTTGIRASVHHVQLELVLAMSVARGLCRKAKITSTTSTTASTSSSCTWCTEARMPVVRSDSTSTLSEAGRPAVNSGRRCLIASTVAMTLAPGWRCTFRTIEGSSWPSSADQAPSFTFSALSTTCATWPRRTGALLRKATTRFE